MKKWKCCLTAIVIAAGSMLVGCQESSSAKPIEAMYIPAGEDGHLMVGEGTGNVFTVKILFCERSCIFPTIPFQLPCV